MRISLCCVNYSFVAHIDRSIIVLLDILVLFNVKQLYPIIVLMTTVTRIMPQFRLSYSLAWNKFTTTLAPHCCVCSCSLIVVCAVVQSLLCVQLFSRLPIEMLEAMLIRTASVGFASNNPSTFDHHRDMMTKLLVMLGSVSRAWHWTIVGWPQSTTGRWFRRQMRRYFRSCKLAVYVLMQSCNITPSKSISFRSVDGKSCRSMSLSVWYLKFDEKELLVVGV
jgi:hypothetical protein